MAGRFSFKEVQIFHDKSLGSGAYGAVYKAKCDQLPCAAKLLHPMFTASQDPVMRETIERFHQECDFLSSLKHPNIVQFLGVHTDPSTNQTALLMELMDESLTTLLSRHSLDHPVPLHTQVDVCHDISLALHYLHINAIIHRDLSSNNVLLLGERRAKLTDLGVSRLKSAAQRYMTQCPGSPVYMPPEALRSFPEYTEKLDTFSFGVLLVQLITCRFPNPGMHEVLVADANSPTGFISMPVQERDRRAEDIGRIPDGNPLYPTALACLEDMPSNRPLAETLCQFFEEQKASADYILSMDNASTSDTITAKPTATEQTQQQVDVNSLLSDLTSKETEIQQLKEDIKAYEDKLTEQVEALRLTEEKLTATSTQEAEPISNQGMEPVPTTSISAQKVEHISTTSSNGRKIIRGLNVDIVNLLSKSHEGELMGVTYNSPDIGDIAVTPTSMESTNTRVQKVMHKYQKMANIPTSLEFVCGPTGSNQELIQGLMDRYNSAFTQCSFRYLAELHAIQIVALSPTLMAQARQHIENEIVHSIFMSCNRRLRLMKRDIVKEKVDVLVSAANKHLSLQGGLSGAINHASSGKQQEYCKAYIARNGVVPEGSFAMTYGGNGLKCNFVLHAVSPDGTKHDNRTNQRMMTNLVHKCLDKAEALSAISIAIPAIGTGHHSIPKKMAANALITAVLDHTYTDQEVLKDIRIVIIDDHTYNEFSEVFRDRKIDYEKAVSPGEVPSVFVPEQSPVSLTGGGSCRQQ